MAKGELALVLHAHLPYVRSVEAGSLEEDWFFQALMECYLPLLELLELSHHAPGETPKITIGLSPTLLSLLSDKQLQQKFPEWLSLRIDFLGKVPPGLRNAADHLVEKISHQMDQWHLSDVDLVGRFANLQREGVVDLLTCAATHGYLPILRENPQVVRGQLLTAVREHTRLIGQPPLGIWLPECAYYEGLDEWLFEAGLRYAVLDGHGLLHASPRPRYGLYAPIVTRKGVAFFGRDSVSTLPVWSAREGYPGDAVYREFHKDLGWELSTDELKVLGIDENRPLGLKLFRVTDPSLGLDSKEVYEPLLASQRVKEHAREYLNGRQIQFDQLSRSLAMEVSPLLVAPFDAELFGHWWFEGPEFLGELFKQGGQIGVSFTRLRDVLDPSPLLQLCEPSPSSWGKGGFHDYWLNESNSWIVPEWSSAGKAMVDRCSVGVETEYQLRVLKQAARELLLSQSSDWSFILRAGTTTELAKTRIHRHLDRFWSLIRAIDGQIELPESNLMMLEEEDCLFPTIQVDDWGPIPGKK